jgi:two-component system response regulator PilR (NtrC family)
MHINCRTAANLKQAYDLLEQHSFDLCLTDMRLPDGKGIDLVRHIQRDYPATPIAVITAYGSSDLAVESLKAGAFDFITKPVDLARLRNLVKSALKLDSKAPTAQPSQNHDGLLGNSDAMLQVRSMIQKISRSMAPVHISGESGTGKELVARLIHQQSPRSDQPFIAINCGAIPSELMESEFFGHKKGSFTGAVRDKEGFFHAANGGTLFLDEVAELPLSMQAKLLRAIQERSIRMVGNQAEEAIDVRILSATNKSLQAMVLTGAFRNDLYYRLNVIELSLPPLRERSEDIEQIATHVIARITQDGQNVPNLTQRALNALISHPFPGNIRELENVLERAIALHEGGDLDIDDLFLSTNQNGSKFPTQIFQEGSTYDARGDTPLEDYLTDIEQREILATLDQCQWNRTEAAGKLGLTMRQLRHKMTKFGIQK